MLRNSLRHALRAYALAERSGAADGAASLLRTSAFDILSNQPVGGYTAYMKSGGNLQSAFCVSDYRAIEVLVSFQVFQQRFSAAGSRASSAVLQPSFHQHNSVYTSAAQQHAAESKDEAHVSASGDSAEADTAAAASHAEAKAKAEASGPPGVEELQQRLADQDQMLLEKTSEVSKCATFAHGVLLSFA